MRTQLVCLLVLAAWVTPSPAGVRFQDGEADAAGAAPRDAFAFEGSTPAPPMSVSSGCEVPAASLEGPEDLESGTFVGLVVAHHNAGTTPATADASNVAFLEVRGAQLATSLFADEPADHAFHAFVPMPTSDGSNLPPVHATLDAMTADFGEPSFGGAPAVWTVDRHGGLNVPGSLVGARAHTLLFGATIADVEQTFPTPDEQILRLLLGIDDGLLHRDGAPEVDLATARAWDGAAFTLPVPGLFPVAPLLSTTSRLGFLGHATDAALLTGSADPGFVSLWGTVPCARDSLAFVASNRLALTLVDEKPCYAPGDLLEVQLTMSCLDQDVTGFFASVSFDPTVLALQPSDTGSPPSEYTNAPFPLHIGAVIDDVGGGLLLLDGSVDFVDRGTTADALLATLFFEVLPGNDGVTSAVGFTPFGSFPSELSFAGLPLVTWLSSSPGFTVDEHAPLVACGADVVASADAGQCSAQIVLTPPAVGDGCGVLSVTAVRDDGLSLDDPYPAGCTPGAETLVTWTVSDCAGHEASCVQSVRVTDLEGPTLSGVPADMMVVASAPDCSAVVTYAEPTASDACDPSPLLTCVPPSGSTFPAGLTTVTCTAVDSCGNVTVETFDVEVVAVESAFVTIDLVGVTIPVSRCIRFVDDACTVVAEVSLAFVDHDGDDANSNGYDDATEGTTDALSTPVRFSGFVPVTCSDTDTLCVKDPQHTMWDTTTLTRVGASWFADSVVALGGGDTDVDGDVDISDIVYFFIKFGTPQRVGTCPFTGFPRDADFSNNGMVGSEDYAFLVANYLQSSSCVCTDSTPPSPFDTAMLAASLAPDLQPLIDVDGDGWIDATDVRALERRHGLPDTLSRALER